MPGLAAIFGSGTFGPEGADAAAIAARHGVLAIQRHDDDGRYVLPHRIDHEANLRRLAAAGCDRVLAIGSVGSLRPELAVGSFVCPHDFIALQLALTTREDASAHALAGFDPAWRSELLSAWAGGPVELRDGGVYWQTTGPRFETPAEIRLIAAHADLVGMTLASECIVAGELGLAYAAVCVVDNLANGIGPAPLSPQQLDQVRAANARTLCAALDVVLPKVAG